MQFSRAILLVVFLFSFSASTALAQKTMENICAAMTKIMDNHPRHFQDVAGEPIMEEPYHYKASFVMPNAIETNITIDERNEDDPETEYYTVVGRYAMADEATYEKAYRDLIAEVKSCDFFLYWKETDHIKFPTDKVPLAHQGRHSFRHYEWGHHVELTVGLWPNGDTVDLYVRFSSWH